MAAEISACRFNHLIHGYKQLDFLVSMLFIVELQEGDKRLDTDLRKQTLPTNVSRHDDKIR